MSGVSDAKYSAKNHIHTKLFVVCFPGVTTLLLCFHSPIAGFSLLILEVS